MTVKNALFVVFILISKLVDGQTDELPAIVIHGGAGTIERGMLSDSVEAEIRAVLNWALDSGYAVLQKGGTSVDAVETAIVILENSHYFNAGLGAVMNSEGKHELDASIMNGKTLEAGAVAGVSIVKNPIKAAIAVMDHSPHVMLSGEGADRFAMQMDLDTVDNSYFTTERTRANYNRINKKKKEKSKTGKHGTVGAVAIDKNGNIAAGTSTGGMMNKAYGRIGDSPIIGAGTYADNRTCGVSCTGQGEYFIRIGVAKEISDRMAFGGSSLNEAAKAVIQGTLTDMGALGGIIAIDAKGNIEMVFNTPGMYRGAKNAEGSEVHIYGADQ